MDKQAIIQSQVDQFYADISAERGNRVKVRNWSITIWIALIALFESDKIRIDLNTAFLVLLFINLIFWLLEGLHQSLALMNQKRVQKLEKLLAADTIAEIPLDHFFISGYYTTTTKEKFRSFFRSCMLAETVVGFHLLMIAGSLVFVFVVK